MKKPIIFKLCVFMVACLLPAAPLRAEEIKLCVPNNYAPYSSLDKNNNYVGFDIELWKAMKVETPYRYVPVDFPSGIAGLEDESCDIFLTNLSITKERARRIDFSKPYLQSGLAVMVLKDNDKINSVADLDKKVIAVSNGTTGDAYVSKNIKAEAIMAVTGDEQSILDLLMDGQADAIVHDLPILQYLEQTTGKGHVRILDTLLAEEEYAFGFPKGSPLKHLVDMKISELRANGTVDRIYKSIFTRVISMKSDSSATK